MKLRVACVAWKIRHVKGDADYFGHFYDLVSAAHDEGAEVVVFPELHCLELLPLASDLYEKDAAKYLAQYGEAIEGWIKRISDSSDMIIVGGSHFKQTGEGIRNVCAVGVPSVGVALSEKNNLTGYERRVWKLDAGEGLAKLPKHLGVTISYDAEFPGSGRALAEHGALLQCVPSWSETEREFRRTRWACLARANENQVFVAHSALVGELGYEPVPKTYGSSAILAPAVEPFPASSILRETELNREGVIVADLDLALLRKTRRGAEAANWADRDSATWEMTDALPASPEESLFSGPSDTNPNGELN